MPRKERIIELETLRGMAFAAVVLQHSIAHYSLVPQAGLQDGVVLAMLLMLAKFAVPLFIFITGMVLFYNTGDQLHYGQFMRKRGMDVILPYVVWTLIYFILTPSHWTAFGWQELSDLALKVVTGKTASHFWYIIMLIQFYVFFPLFLRGIRYIYQRFQARGRMIALLISGIVYLILADQLRTIARWMEPLQIPVLTDAFTTYADRNFIYFFFYFVLGAAAGLSVQSWREWVHRLRWVSWLVFIILGLRFIYLLMLEFQKPDGIQITFYTVSLIRPDMILFLLASMLVLYQLALKLQQPKVLQGLAWIGGLSYGGYLMHMLVLRYSYIPDEWLYVAWGWNPVVRMLVTWLTALAASCGLTWLISRCRWGKWIVGSVSVKRTTTQGATDSWTSK
ncbi:surface polysaccharide O-acyltransferase-like enzyme [Paenibacillus barcinonensis]|uniref:Surface polysaccharide O-acyltransferase-like enzyme n=1 Tax=Paenibacillus barcinonensis TaxID=198119 RepID=A0A2V4VE05_PAEBA|nr:acyltransferase [Paenibacillus barcinonensis]PYE52080.1 surface polysaccharide O-acyltransferase-like enzyme [Paenibacillus barcinonensis]